MENEALRTQKENEKLALEQYMLHPFTKQILDDSHAEQEVLIDLLCMRPVNNIETFFAHFEAIGHLRGLRRGEAMLQETLKTIEQELKELE